MTAPARAIWVVDQTSEPMLAPQPTPATISVIIPVKNNPAGMHRLLGALRGLAPMPGQIVVVDNNSRQPLDLSHFELSRAPVILLSERRPGPAAARNAGARAASGSWLLFLDSDCVPDPDLIQQFCAPSAGAVGYAGAIRALGSDRWSKYYESQRILEPPEVEGEPPYLVTANCLVWKPAFERVGGFDPAFSLAAGEDIDLAVRLRTLGALGWCRRAIVAHDFEPSLAAFLKRFVRYGRGNWRVQDKHGYDMRPRPFLPMKVSLFNVLAAGLQWLALLGGYSFDREATRIAERSRT